MSVVPDKHAYLKRFPFGGEGALVVALCPESTDAQEWRDRLLERFERVDIVAFEGVLHQKGGYDLVFVTPEIVLVNLLDWSSDVLKSGGFLYAVVDSASIALSQKFPGDMLSYPYIIHLLQARLHLVPSLLLTRLRCFARAAMVAPAEPVPALFSPGGAGVPFVWLLPTAQWSPIVSLMVRIAKKSGSFKALRALWSVLRKKKAELDIPHAVADAGNIIQDIWLQWAASLGCVEIGRCVPGHLLMASPLNPVESDLQKAIYIDEVVLWKPDRGMGDETGRDSSTYSIEHLTHQLSQAEDAHPFMEGGANGRMAAMMDLYSQASQANRYVANVQSGDSYRSNLTYCIREASREWGGVGHFYATLGKACQTDKGSPDEVFERLYLWLQGAFFHHPYLQILGEGGDIERDPVTLCYAGIGRCGHIAAVAKEIFNNFGFDARIVQLAFHLCAEVRVGGKWRIVDCDAFKAGIYPRTANGEWASIDDMRAMPWRLDHCPAIGLQLSDQGMWARNAYGDIVSGYVDTGMSWDRPYLSVLYFGGDKTPPPKPPRLAASFRGSKIHMEFGDILARTKVLKVSVGTSPRGWTYSDIPGAAYLRAPASDVADITLPVIGPSTGLNLDIDVEQNHLNRDLYLNVWAQDARMVADDGIHVWPGDEVTMAPQSKNEPVTK